MHRNVDRGRPMPAGVRGSLRLWLGILLVALTALCATPAAAQVLLPDGRAAIAYGPVVISDPAGPITLVTGAVPFGMNLDMGTGVLDGTPFEFGTTLLDVEFAGGAVTTTYSLTIAPPDLVLDPTPLPPAMVGRPYSATRAATGTGSGFQFYCSCVINAVPPQPGGPPYFFPILGLDHNLTTGEFFGTPTDAATLTINAQVVDLFLQDIGTGFPFEGPIVTYTLVITSALALAPSALPAATEGAAYNPADRPGNGRRGTLYLRCDRHAACRRYGQPRDGRVHRHSQLG